MASQTFTVSGTWTCPAGVTSVQVEAIGGGGAGGGSSGGGGGGGGGAYARSNTVTVVPGNIYTVTVGTGGTHSGGPAATDSSFSYSGTTYTLARAGANASSGGSNAGASGGGASVSTGDIKFDGGSGGSGSGASLLGGGGGSSAGSASVGNNGTSGSISGPGTGGAAPTGGGAGGNGGTTTGFGGGSPGGGGGGGGNSNGGNGGPGQVILTWTDNAITLGAASQDADASLNVNVYYNTLTANSDPASASLNANATQQLTLTAASQDASTILAVGNVNIGTLAAQSDDAAGSFNSSATLQANFSAQAFYAFTSFNAQGINTDTLTLQSQQSTTTINVVNTIIAIINNAMAQDATAAFSASASLGINLSAVSQPATTQLSDTTLFYVNIGLASQNATTQLHVTAALPGTFTLQSADASASINASNIQQLSGTLGLHPDSFVLSFNALVFNNAIQFLGQSDPAQLSFSSTVITQPTNTATLTLVPSQPSISLSANTFVGTNTLNTVSNDATASFNLTNQQIITDTFTLSSSDATAALNIVQGIVATLSAASGTSLISFNSNTSSQSGISLQASNSTTQLTSLITVGCNIQLVASYSNTASFTTNGTYTWTCPPGITSIQVECWGAGGGGGASASNRGSGGGGGAYARRNSYSVVPGNSYNVNVGLGGVAAVNNGGIIGAAGGDSWFDVNTNILAKGATGGSRFNAGIGGQSSSCIGDAVFSGGNGQTSSAIAGGGGSSAGNAANGTNGSGTSGGIAPAGGGNGGDGLVNGFAPGGGGGSNSGAGADGQVLISYSISPLTLNVINAYETTLALTSTDATASFSLGSPISCTLAAQPSNAEIAFTSYNTTPIVIQTQGTFVDLFNSILSILLNATQGIISPSNCLFSVLPDPEQAPGSPFAYIFPNEFITAKESVIGAGRYCTIMKGSFDVRLYVRNYKDPAYWDTDSLTNEDQSTGIYSVVNAIYNALHLCFPVDSIGNFICTEPPRFLSVTKVHRVPNAEEYSGIYIKFSSNIELSLTN